MQRVKLTDDVEFSRIVYGMWRLVNGEDRSESTVRAKVEACLAQGITTFDQADIYGNYESEEAFGQSLKADPSLRDKIEIASKCGIKLVSSKAPSRRVKHYDTTREHIIASVENSLSRMGIEHLDLLMIHRPDPLFDAEETGGALDALVESGKVEAVGVSNFRPWDFSLLQSAMHAKLVTNQVELSILHTEPFINGDIAFLQEHGIRPMAWSPLGGGALFGQAHAGLLAKMKALGEAAGVDASAVALAFLLAHPSGVLPVVGTNNLSRIAALSDAFKVEMDRETWFELYEQSLGHEVP
ncbi:MAG: aldo/keto reductase [Pseudomonadota bacterium]